MGQLDLLRRGRIGRCGHLSSPRILLNSRREGEGGTAGREARAARLVVRLVVLGLAEVFGPVSFSR